jgi:hypothetical protein
MEKGWQLNRGAAGQMRCGLTHRAFTDRCSDG